MKVFLKKNDFTIGLAVILIFASYIFLPFFLYTPIIQISEDTFSYSYLAKVIFDNEIPILDLPIDIPIGYSVLIFLIKKSGFGLLQLVMFQLIVYITAFIFLAYQVSKKMVFGSLPVALAFVFHSFNSYTIRSIFKIYPDSIYSSVLIFLIGFIILYFRKKNKKSIFLIFIAISINILLRSNGVYLLFIPLFIFFFHLYEKEMIKYIIGLGLSFLVFISSLNLFVKNSFSFFDYKRVNELIEVLYIKDSVELNSKQNTDENSNKSLQFSKYYFSFLDEKASFYYSLQKSNYDFIYKKNLKKIKLLGNRKNSPTISEDLLSFTLDGAIGNKEIYEIIDFKNHKNNLWIYSIYFIQKVLYLSRINYMFFAVFNLMFFYFLFITPSKQKKLELALIYLIHFISFLILPFIHGRVIYRYLHVSEFIVFVLPLIVALYKLNNLKKIVKQ